MPAYELYEPIGQDVPVDIYLGLMLERKKIDLEPITSKFQYRILTLGERTVIPFDVEEDMEKMAIDSAKDIAKELRRGMSKWRKGEISINYIEKFVTGTILSKV